MESAAGCSCLLEGESHIPVSRLGRYMGVLKLEPSAQKLGGGPW
jgi:hypothetical protein